MAATGTPTPNLGLRIPVGTDPASVDDINYNSNLLDTALGAVGNTSVKDQLDELSDQIAPLTKITKKFEGSSTYSIGSFGSYNIAICALYVENTGTSIISVQTVGSSVSIVHIAGTQNATNAISGSISNGTLTLTASNKFTISFINATMNY